eukprot:CAMPEP_0194172844 /NCGR_PEP_ID=MMETSP0154-20130528/7250_1 /TAXON_ID=1049557 /ORGANISM="Thalassiothrix antarctica, Strain L6-D1" /LENGTH=321 /DNA_ID=CAMNT_0038885649 /DNA_START=44 /DNA_END=1006 /DNA_ORIENTATION=+
MYSSSKFLMFATITLWWEVNCVLSLSTATSAITTSSSTKTSSGSSHSVVDDKSKLSVAIDSIHNVLDNYSALKRHCEIGETKKHGRGLIATKNLDPGEVAFQIPLNLALIEIDNKNNNNAENEGDDDWAGRLANRLITDDNNNFYAQNIVPLLEPPMTPARGDWPEWILNEFDNEKFVSQDLNKAQDWRYNQWEKHCKDRQQRQYFLDALDMVCSRTMRCGNDMMLVPFLDMANHASEAEGGGYYQVNRKSTNNNHQGDIDSIDNISLIVGERGVSMGEEITLNYGYRSNEDWILHYGFLPHRNEDQESIELSSSGRIVTW